MTVPWVTKLTMDVTSVAAGVNISKCFEPAPFDGQVTLVQFVPNLSQAHATAVAATLRTYVLYNRGLDGAGTTALANGRITSPAASQNAFNTGLEANIASTLPLTTTTLLTITQGAILEWESSESGGTGLRDVGGRVVVTLSRI